MASHIADFTDEVNGVRSHVDQTGADKFTVRLQDVDSGEFIPDCRIYGALGDAMAYARKLAGLPSTPEGGALAATADPEYKTRIDADRCTWQFKQRSSKRLDSGREPIECSPLFGGPAQERLF